jgi:hypothetical protein
MFERFHSIAVVFKYLKNESGENSFVKLQQR